jgi:UDP-N-acetylglucosamine 2-epimerase (hydrolysing)
MKKILFITGTRADFGKLKPLMNEVENDPGFECYIFSTGMHTLSRYGSTFEEIRKSGFNNIFLHINQTLNTSSDMDMVLANTVQGIGHYIREFKPDMIIVHGDRVEAMAGAIVGALNNILVSHIEGGELSGTVDELIRHSTSKLSHLHFVANENAKKRLMQMGEIKKSIFVVGSPDIDVMLSENLPSMEEVRRKYEISFNKYSIFIYHPVTTEQHKLMGDIKEVIGALKASKRNFVCIYPNNDKGSDVILESLLQLENNRKFKLFPSLRFEYFLTLLKNAESIIGNSSSGIREAPVYGIPTINIGSRQNNRYNHKSIVNVPEDKKRILEAILNPSQISDSSFYFGKGDSAKHFIKKLKTNEIWKTSCQKQFKDASMS